VAALALRLPLLEGLEGQRRPVLGILENLAAMAALLLAQITVDMGLAVAVRVGQMAMGMLVHLSLVRHKGHLL
jgi:hypothetical protein